MQCIACSTYEFTIAFRFKSKSILKDFLEKFNILKSSKGLKSFRLIAFRQSSFLFKS